MAEGSGTGARGTGKRVWRWGSHPTSKGRVDGRVDGRSHHDTPRTYRIAMYCNGDFCVTPTAGWVHKGGVAATRARVSQAEYEALAELRFRLRQFLHFSESAAVAAGITPQQHQALLAIRGFHPSHVVTVGALAERLLLRHHSVVGLVDRLVAERLVQRRRNRVDGRLVQVTLTRRGTAVLEKLSATHRAQLRKISPKILRLLEGLRDASNESR